MKELKVVAALIEKDGKYLIARRSTGDESVLGKWEFPGGKIEPGESREVALKREIQEELGVDIAIENILCTTEYDYPSFHLTMHSYLCSIASGEIELREHKSARWLRPEELGSVEWLPADKDAISRLNNL